jgi:hypothetical protein
MSNNDFFLDSGLVYADVDYDDDFNKSFLKYRTSYPYEENNYYAVKRVTMREIKSIRSNKRKRPGTIKSHKAGTLFLAQLIARAENLFDTNKIRDKDYSSSHVVLFRTLYRILYNLLESGNKDLNKKDRDADILTNAFIWDKNESDLCHPTFVTIDRTDIYDRRTDHKIKADECLENKSHLEFCLISKHMS